MCPRHRAPWLPGSPTVLIGNLPALDDQSKLMCMWGGLIQITMAGQLTVAVP
ncbi:PAAR-like protein [Tunturiibacter gelidiferens]|uniref:PAAR-like protein n=1 Tax=Tunturiibacter gelidiferens TaxID=3069689 RepID=UPI003D9BAB5B